MPDQVLDDIQIKALDGQFNIDEAKGIVECFVAAIGNKDSVGDIILPGAFNQSLKRRWPRVVWGHDWNQPIGKVLEIYEVGPDDPRLPMKMKANRVGGLYCKMQFNLKSERGREAFASVAFFGTDQEFSIGYKTLDADYDHSRQANLLKVVELYEVSPVLHGANQLTAAISIKDGKAALPDAIPQENFTGDVMRGYGPRRGNLERLLRYWRPIMKKPGGFRRCLVILADHPELYPLQRICAWLHHETTGLWPNEGCHHPGMKNCRNKLRGVRNGSLWTDAEFSRRLDKIPDGKSLDEDGDVTDDDIVFANTVLKQFMDGEPDFVKYLADDKNWMHVGDDDDDVEVEHDWVKGDSGCGCGGCGKSAEADVEFKAGRVLSNANLAKISQAIDLLQQVVASGARLEQKETVVISVDPENMFDLKAMLDPIVEYHGGSVEIDEASGSYATVTLASGEMALAVKSALGHGVVEIKALNSDDIQFKSLGRAIGRMARGGGGGGAKGKLRRSLRKATVDPNARDADGDGMVQEGTTAQRRATGAKPNVGRAKRRMAGAKPEGSRAQRLVKPVDLNLPDFDPDDADARKFERSFARRIEQQKFDLIEANDPEGLQNLRESLLDARDNAFERAKRPGASEAEADFYNRVGGVFQSRLPMQRDIELAKAPEATPQREGVPDMNRVPGGRNRPRLTGSGLALDGKKPGAMAQDMKNEVNDHLASFLDDIASGSKNAKTGSVIRSRRDGEYEIPSFSTTVVSQDQRNVAILHGDADYGQAVMVVLREDGKDLDEPRTLNFAIVDDGRRVHPDDAKTIEDFFGPDPYMRGTPVGGKTFSTEYLNLDDPVDGQKPPIVTDVLDALDGDDSEGIDQSIEGFQEFVEAFDELLEELDMGDGVNPFATYRFSGQLSEDQVDVDMAKQARESLIRVAEMMDLPYDIDFSKYSTGELRNLIRRMRREHGDSDEIPLHSLMAEQSAVLETMLRDEQTLASMRRAGGWDYEPLRPIRTDDTPAPGRERRGAVAAARNADGTPRLETPRPSRSERTGDRPDPGRNGILESLQDDDSEIIDTDPQNYDKFIEGWSDMAEELGLDPDGQNPFASYEFSGEMDGGGVDEEAALEARENMLRLAEALDHPADLDMSSYSMEELMSLSEGLQEARGADNGMPLFTLMAREMADIELLIRDAGDAEERRALERSNRRRPGDPRL